MVAYVPVLFNCIILENINFGIAIVDLNQSIFMTLMLVYIGLNFTFDNLWACANTRRGAASSECKVFCNPKKHF